MSKVLFISYDGLTDQLGQSQILPYIFGLEDNGYNFHIISFEKEKSLYSKEFVLNSFKRRKIDWYPLTYHKKPPVLSTLLDVYRMHSLANEIVVSQNIKLVHCRSYLSSLVGLRLKKKFGVKFIFDMRGLWADERVDGNLWNLSNPVYKAIYTYFKKKEREFLAFADTTISLTENGKNEIISWYSGLDYKPNIKVIPCSTDTELFSVNRVDKNFREDLYKKLKIGQRKVLLYLGSLGTWYMLDEMLSFFRRLNHEGEWFFLFLTREDEMLKDRISKFGLSSEEVAAMPVKRDFLPTYLSLVDWGVFFIKPAYSKISSSPTKQGELMSFGLPVISNNGVGDTEEILEKYKSGLCLKGFSNADYDHLISQMKSFNVDRTEISKNAEKYFGLSAAIRAYLEVYQSNVK